ncbi:MAG: LytTR family transcriptional regulator DNA-binding domain-containing protein [Ruminococcus sp.]|nr:LytTR family transcriptional regulator DNA-binding domain-containing protein [Ruminococcus sp.]
MIKIAVCDDRLTSIGQFVEVMEDYLKPLDAKYSIDYYDTAAELVSRVESGSRYDVYVLDFYMDINGDQLIYKLREYDNDFFTAVVSMIDTAGTLVCRARADIYVYKDMPPERMRYEVAYLFRRFFSRHQTCTLKTDSGDLDIETREVVYIESLKRTVIAHLTDGRTMRINNGTLSKIAEQPEFCGFLHPGRSHLINCLAIRTINHKEIVLKNGERFNFPRSRMSAALKKYADVMAEYV